MKNIKIGAIDIYRGGKIESSEFYLEHFKNKGKNMTNYFKAMGRDKRYLIDSEQENALTMSLEVAKNILKKNDLTGEDIDMIVYSSQLPEYVAPPNAIFIHETINGKRETVCYDMNANCAGMIVAVDNACSYMKSHPEIKRALIVGCDYINATVNPEDELTYGQYGDASCAVILEQTDEDTGYLDTAFFINSIEAMNILTPGCGFSKIFKEDVGEYKYLKWNPFGGSDCVYPGIDNMNKLMKKHGLTKEDINMFCFSQFAYKNVQIIREEMNLKESQSLFIGNEYGYTGTTSPFIVLYEALQRGMVKRNDYVMFWTVGAGSTNVTMLFKF